MDINELKYLYAFGSSILKYYNKKAHSGITIRSQTKIR